MQGRTIPLQVGEEGSIDIIVRIVLFEVEHFPVRSTFKHCESITG